MTRESEKTKIRMSVVVDRKHINSLKKADEVIDQIFDEHEAQLKAKDERVAELEKECEFDQRNASTSQKECVSLFEQLKVKDEEIKNLGEVIQQYLIPSKNYETQLREERKKARSIVAMLFWEMKLALKDSNNSALPIFMGRANQSFYLYKKAYAMLKGNR